MKRERWEAKNGVHTLPANTFKLLYVLSASAKVSCPTKMANKVTQLLSKKSSYLALFSVKTMCYINCAFQSDFLNQNKKLFAAAETPPKSRAWTFFHSLLTSRLCPLVVSIKRAKRM
jgi:hypothetical protein